VSPWWEVNAKGRAGPRVADLGMAVQVDPIKTTLKAPGTKPLKLKCNEPLSSFAFNFNLRSYTWDHRWTLSASPRKQWT